MSEKAATQGQRQSTAPPTGPEFSEIVIFYNWVFDLSRIVDPTEAARRLLNTDFALCAPNYVSDEIEIATRFRGLNQLRESALNLAEVEQILNVHGVRGLARWVRQHPRQAWRLWRKHREAVNHAAKDTARENTSAQTDVATRVAEVVRILDESMTEMQAFVGLQRFADRQLFTPFYLREVPFVRVGLQPFSARAAGHDLAVDVGVLIHRSGIAVLSFYVEFDGTKSLDDIIDLQIASNLTLESSEIVRAIVEPQARAEGLSRSAMDAAPFDRSWSGDIEWFRYQHSGDAVLTHIFDLYREAIISAVLGREPAKPDEPYSWLRCSDWFAYPIVFLRHVSPAISDSTTFREHYSRQLAGLTMRFPGWQRLNQDRVEAAIAKDVALTEDHAVYIEAGNTTVLYYEPYRQNLAAKFGDDVPGQEWLAAHFQTSALIEMILVQWGILHTLDQRIYEPPGDLSTLNALKRDFALAVQEYHDPLFSYGTAQDITRQARETLGIAGMYQRITEKLVGLDRLIQAEESNQRAKRDTWLKVAAFLGTILFGLVGAKQTVEVLGEWHDVIMRGYNGWGASIAPLANFAQAHSIDLALLLYLVAVGVIVLVSLGSLWPRRSKRPVIQLDHSEAAYTPGFAWPIKRKWVAGDQKANPERKSQNDA